MECSEEKVPDSFPEAHRKKESLLGEEMLKRRIRILNRREAEGPGVGAVFSGQGIKG